MTTRDFCYWLQGYFELADPDNNIDLTHDAKMRIRRHLAMVFAYDIDPNTGNADQQAQLSHLHDDGGSLKPRC
jgi:hypothetical protein